MAITLASNALVTLEEVRLALGMPYATDANNVAIGMTNEQSGSFAFAVNAASTYAETHCNRTFLSGSAAVEIFDGRGHNQFMVQNHTLYTTEQAPITSSPLLQRWTGTAWTAVDTSAYTSKSVEGEVYFPAASYGAEGSATLGSLSTDGNLFVKGTQNYRVTYDYGYDGVDNVPQDLKQPVILLTRYFKIAGDVALGIASTSDSTGKTKTYKADSVPDVINKMLDKYVR